MPQTLGLVSSSYAHRNRYAWGAAANGGLGNNTTTPNLSSPTLVDSDGDWDYIEVSFGWGIGVKNGKLFSWGANTNGATGQGTTTGNTLVPTQIGSASNWKQVSLGQRHVLALKTDGTLWAWGRASNGTLGNNTTTPDLSTPTQIGSDSDWEMVAAGNSQSQAIKTNGKLYGWGFNNVGQVGDGTTTQRLVPTQIGTDTDWKYVTAGNACNFAIKDDGSLYSWGINSLRELGLGTTITPYTSPTRVGSDNDWEEVRANNAAMAIKGGTLWGWGYNLNGTVGNNSTTNQSSPVQIDSNTGWTLGIQSRAGGTGVQAAAAIRGGKLYTWGSDTTGQLGNGSGSTSDVLVPTQIGTDSDWKQVAIGRTLMVAIKG